MANRMALKWDGLSELRRMFATIPAVLQPEATARVFAHAGAAATALRGAYQSRTGNLRRGVRLEQHTTRSGPATVLVSGAPHAWLVERGTEPREGRGGNAIGKGSRSHGKLANRGFMPAAHTFGQIIAAARQPLIDDLTQLLIKRGFEVRGAA